MARSIEEIKAQLEMIETRIDAITGANPGQYSSDEIAQMYALDPKAAEFFANKQINEARIKETTYTPEQKSLIDAKQQNRIRMGEIQSSINLAKTETEKDPWMSQYKTLQERDVFLNNKLAELNTPGYSTIEVKPKDDKDGGGPVLTVISPTENVNEYLSFTSGLNPNSYKKLSDVPAAATIQAQARVQKYDLSSENAKEINLAIRQSVSDRTGERDAALEKAKAERDEHKVDKEKKITKWETDNKAIIDRIKTTSILKNAFKDLSDKTNQLNVKKIRLRMASNESVNDSDIINANDFNALQAAASKFGVSISGLTYDGAVKDVEFIKRTFNDISNMLKTSAGSDNDLINEANKILRTYNVPSFSSTPPAGGTGAGEAGKLVETTTTNGITITRIRK